MEHDFSQPVTDLAKVPRPFAAFYNEEAGEDGVFTLRDDPAVGGAVEVITGLGKSLKASRADAKAHKAKAVDLSALSEYGESVDEIASGVKTRLDELTEQIKGGKSAKLNAEKLKADLGAAHATELESKDKRIKSLLSQLYDHLIVSEARKAMGDKVVNQDLAMPHVLERIRPIEEDGKYGVFVIDEDGDRRHGPTGAPMTVTELLAEMETQEKYAPLFKSEAKRGAGTPPGAPSRPTSSPAGEKKTSVDKIASGLEARSRR